MAFLDKNEAFWLAASILLSLQLLANGQKYFLDTVFSQHVEVYENATNGTVVTNISDANSTAINKVESITYSGFDRAFIIKQVDGEPKWQVILNRTLDYDRGERNIVVRFKATGGSDTYSTESVIQVIVKDVNDNSPQFENQPYNADVNEDESTGSQVYTNIHATDIDNGPGGNVRYKLEPVTQGGGGTEQDTKFMIDAITGNLTLNGSLDYESKTFYHFIVIASDQGTPSLNSTTDLFVTVKDVQDSPPVFTNLPYVKSVDENTAQGHAVLTVKAVDQDQAIPNQVGYNITHTDCPGLFALGANSGIISVGSTLDRDNSTLKNNAGRCAITVQATEQSGPYAQKGNFIATETVTITVNDVNDNAPTFSGSSFSANITENSPAGTPLQLDSGQQIVATDIDQGLNSEIHLSLLGANDTFELVTSSLQGSGTVQLRVKNSARLDFEVRQSLNVQITAFDKELSHATAIATVTVNIENVNEDSPEFRNTEYTAAVLEGSASGTPLATVQATDTDAGRYGNVIYTLRNDRGLFQIDSHTGAVTVASNQTDREREDRYYMMVVATDGGDLQQTVPLTVTITDRNDNPPVFQRDQYDAVLREGDTVFSRLVKVEANDADEPNTPNSNVTFSINQTSPSGLQNHFRLDPISGQLTVTHALDFERIQFSSGPIGVVNLVVVASDRGTPSKQATAAVDVTLIDINDKSPMFKNLPYSAQVLEGSTEGSFVLNVSATDADGTAPNNVITYSIESGGQDRFRINSDNGTITVSGAIDREQVSNYVLVVVARDRAASSRSNSSSVTITITDVNDELPTFGSKADVRIERNESFHGVLYDMTATDPDEDSALIYQILYDESSGQSGTFQSLDAQTIQSWVSIDLNTGQVRALHQLNRTAVQTLVLAIQVNDTKGESIQLSKAKLTITVIDINDHSPQFSPSNSVTARIRENMGQGTALTFTTPLRISDLDEGVNSLFEVNITGNNAAHFEVVPSTVQSSADLVVRVTDGSVLDYEFRRSLSIMLLARETQTAEKRSSSVVITVQIEDENDNSPVFDKTSYEVTIQENEPARTFVTVVNATDDDGSMKFSRVTYSLQGAEGLFAINSLTGKVTQNTSSLDYDTQPNTYQMTVLASDSGGRRTSAPLVVKLSDLNDLAPEFDRAGFTARLREDALFFESPLAVHATDGDRPGTPNSNISYSIIGSNPPTFRSRFTMPNNYTGVILVVSRVDFESPRLGSTHTITLTIQAVDGGNPVRSSTSSVGISVLDVNDFPPLFSTNTATRHVFENSSTGTSVYTFNATDRDGGPPNNDVYYLISSGSNDQFAVDSSTGELTVIRSLDREKVASYSLVVLAIDRGVPPKSGTATLSVMIDDVNDVAPVFSQSSITVDVEENTHGVLYTMTATDADVDHQLQYVINWTHSSAQDPLQGDVLNIQNLFSIDRGTGAVSINGTLDRETVQSAVIALEVEDVKAATPGQTATGTLTINVKDKDDNPPLFSVDSVIATVDENAAEGVPINLGQVTVTDPDQDENSAFNLTLSKYNHCLEVLPSSARAEATVLIRVTNVSCFDYEDMTSMNFEVVAAGRGNGHFVTTASVDLSIINVNDVSPVFTVRVYSKNVNENLNVGTSVMKVQAVDLDKPPYNAFTYSLQGGDEVFTINNNSGEVTVAKKELDFEVRKEYKLTVEATDTGGFRDSVPLTITLLDVNDNEPQFLRPEYQAFVRENSNDFERGVTVQASDADGPEGNSEVHYSIPPSSKWAANFTVNETTGVLHLESPLDFEALNPAAEGEITLVVLATDRGSPQLIGSVNVTVTVQDENDKPPVFPNVHYHGNVSENRNSGISVAQVHATDGDRSSPNNDVFYLISSGGNDKFQINSTSGVITTVSGLDREQSSGYNLTVLAVDRGSPALTATTTVSITVDNINDFTPEFTPSQISVSVLENLGRGRAIPGARLAAVDKDEDAHLLYNIAWHNSSGYGSGSQPVSENLLKTTFMINGTNGMIIVAPGRDLDREVLESAKLVIVVHDSNAPAAKPQSATGTINIMVLDADDNPPTFSTNSFTASITENSPLGTPVELNAAMTVTDIDKEENSAFNLTLSKYNQCLEVLPSSARAEATVLIRVTNVSCFDYEKTTSMNFEVVATGRGNGRFVRNASVDLLIINVNDVSPYFALRAYRKRVYESLNVGTSVIRVQARDLDRPPYNAFTYSLQGGDEVFSINNTSGEVMVAKKELDFEVRKEYKLTVEATDTGGFRDSVPLTITLLDVNDNKPQFLRPEYQAFVRENSNDFDRGVTVQASDADGPGGNSEVHYSILLSSKWAANFTVNETTGVLQLESPLDFEALNPAAEGVITLVLLATDRGSPQLTGSVNVTVTVQDANDFTPEFTAPNFAGSVAENEEGTEVTSVSATDRDGSAPNNEVFYLVSSGGNDQFRINSTSGVISTVSPLDRERTSAYSLVVLAVDRGSPSRTASVTVSVDVTNVNDDAPKFPSNDVTVTRKEELIPGSLVYNFTAHDGDEDALLSYRILWDKSEGFNDDQTKVNVGVLQEAFAIDNTTGAVTVNRRLDREALDTATLIIFVEDLHAQTQGQNATGTLTVQVQDIDDSPPFFSHSMFNAIVDENSPEGTPLQLNLQMSLTDNDKDANSRFNLTLSQYTDCLRVIPTAARAQASVVMQVSNLTCFDFEKVEAMDFDVVATPYVNASNAQRATVHLSITNLNDEPPKFPSSSYPENIRENTAPGTRVIIVQASDKDKPLFNNITYSLQGGDGRFVIHNVTGEVTVVNSRPTGLDYETRKHYELIVEATDPGGLQDSASLTITLLDINDNRPEFVRPEYQAFIRENDAAFGTEVTVEATDKDDGANKEISFSIAPSSELADNFTINNTTGRLGLRGSSGLDYESLPNTTTGVVHLVIVACDRGQPPMCSNVALLVTVADQNDNTPSFSQMYHRNISEDALEGASLVTVSATDDDGKAPNNNVFYVMAGGGNDKFKVDSSSGLISRAGKLDSDTIPFYNLTINAIDGGSPALTATTYVTVNVIDVNDVIPTFEPDSLIVRVNESNGMRGSDSGRALTSLWAKDSDVNSALLYDVVWDESLGFGPNQEPLDVAELQVAFKVQNNVAKIQVNSTLDRERISRAILVVNVTDTNAANSSIQTGTGTLTINVLDVNDHTPKFNKRTYTAEIQENSLKDSVLTLVSSDQMSVTDLDTDQNCVFNISVVGPNNGYFKAEPATARSFALVQLRVLNGSVLDYEKMQSITFNLQAMETDTGDHFSDTVSVTVNIIDVNDNDPVFTPASYNTSVTENSQRGTNITTIHAVDQDSGSFGNITYSLEGDADRFFIDPVTGELRTADSSTDRETKDIYLMTAVATDGGGRRSGATLKITVTDVNDEKPRFLSNYSTRVLENSLVLSPPVVLQAEDDDEPNTVNSRLTYHLVRCPPISCANFSLGRVSGQLHITSEVDFEQVRKVQLIVEARDHGASHQLTGTATVTIEIEDVNDVDPRFTQTVYRANVTENSDEGTYITTVLALDGDGSRPNNVTFYVLDSGRGSDKFRINSTTGVITVGPGANLDRERDNANGGFSLAVLASDRGDPPRSSSATVDVSLLDVNDELPVFSEARKEVKIYENASVSDEVALLHAYDNDTDSDLQFIWLLEDSQAATDRDVSVNITLIQNWFEVNPTTGRVSVKSKLDRETAEVIVLKVLVNDTHGVKQLPQTALATLTVTLLDRNDNAPEIRGSKSLRVSESLAVGTEVASLTARDADRDQSVTFTVLNETEAYFDIDSDGKVSLRHQIDREVTPKVNFTVIATDSGLPPLSSNLTIEVTVLDANDNDPRFVNESYVFYVAEDADNETVVTIVRATDADIGPNAKVTFDFADNVLDFVINSTGAITVKRKLDRESIPSYTFGVAALDNPITDVKRRAIQQITVIINDVNDNPPLFTNIDPLTDSYTAQIDETKTEGEKVLNMNPGPVQASDKDEGQNAVLSFYMASQDTGSHYYFTMDESTGEVFVNTSIRGKADTYNHTVTVVDHGQPSLTASASLTIEIKDENTHKPYFVGNYSDLRVPECAKIGDSVWTFVAHDDDRDKETNGKVRYFFDNASTSDSADLTFFNLDPDSGELKTAKLFGTKTKRQFQISIRAQDLGIPTSSSTTLPRITISVDDGNNEQPNFNGTDYSFHVPEEKATVSLGTVYAEDLDSYKRTCYSLSVQPGRPKELADYFNISTNTDQPAELILTRSLDRENASQASFVLWVTAADCTPDKGSCAPSNGKAPDPNAEIRITVTDINDNPPVFVRPEITVGVTSTAKTGHVIVNLQEYVTDPDIGANRRHDFSVAKDLEMDTDLKPSLRTIERPLGLSANGSVTTIADLPGDAEGFFTWVIMANDSAGNDTVTLKIYVVGEDKLIRITFSKSLEELRKTQNAIMGDLTNGTGLQFIADDRLPFEDDKGIVNPGKSVLIVHALNEKKRAMDANALRDFLDHAIEVTTYLKTQQKLDNIETYKAAATKADEKTKTEYILGAVICVLVVAFLITLYMMFNNIRRFKRKLKAATIETYPMSKPIKETFPGLRTPTSNPIFGKEDELNDDRASVDSEDSLDSLDVNRVEHTAPYSNANPDNNNDGEDEEEVTMDLYGEDTESVPPLRMDQVYLQQALAEHERSRNHLPQLHSNGTGSLHGSTTKQNGVGKRYTLHGHDASLDDCESTDI